MSDASLASDELRWSPPIPTIGRGGQRATVPHGASFDCRLKAYYLQTDSCPDFFVRPIPAKFRRDNGCYGRLYKEKIFLADLHWTLQYKFILSKLYGRYSLFFQNKVSSLLKAGKMKTIRQWFYTANGVVFPYLMEGLDDYKVIDRLTRYVLEGCACNYAHFISSLKKMKKLLRKSSAVHNISPRGVSVPFEGKLRQHLGYLRVFNENVKVYTSKTERFRSMLLWTQSRATGLCDSSMIDLSLNKFRKTVTEPCAPLHIDVGVLQSCIRAGNVTGLEAQVSVGPKACLQSPQKAGVLESNNYLPGSRRDDAGGQTRYLIYLASHKVLRGTYDFKTLEVTPCDARPVRSATDLIDWAIQELLSSPWRARSVRYHCVEDQSKARSITVAHYAYQVVMGVFAHALVPAVVSAETSTGLKADRNLWRFLHEQMSPEAPSWDGFDNQPTQGFCTDLEEATDFGNWWFARAIWSELIRQTSGRMQPTALMLLAKTFYTSSRSVFYRTRNNQYGYFSTSRGFLMGDLFTKVVLTIGQDYNVRKALYDSPLGEYRSNSKIERTVSLKPLNLETLKDSGLADRKPSRPKVLGAAYSLVGDDVVVLYVACWPNSQLRPFFETAASTGGWKLSEDDTFDSRHLLFYCEEGALVPRNPLESTRHMIWRGREVKYLDYPRIRLLLPVKVETNLYSQTNVGRFSLLGKEARWVIDTASDRAKELYSTSQVLQKLVVPRDIECLCPYLPIEIGGDGSYDPDPEFISEVIRLKSSSPAESLYRMERQMTKYWSHQYVSSDKPKGGVFKHHLILPTMDRMKRWLPEKAILVPPSEEHNELLRSLPRGILESPQQTFFKIVKRVYYRWLFCGILLPNLMVKADVSSKRGNTTESSLWRWFDSQRISEYLERWRRPGFEVANRDPYFVVPYRHRDIMSPGWVWKTHPEPVEELPRLGIREFLDTILYGKDLPLVVDRLNMFFESDPLLLIRVRERPEISGTVYLVSQDKRLAKKICDFVRSNRDRTSKVILIHPAIFYMGRIEEITGRDTIRGPDPSDIFQKSLIGRKILYDQGSLNFFGRNAGRSNLSDVVCAEFTRTTEWKYPGVYSIGVKGLTFNPMRVDRSINPDVPTIGYIEDLVASNQNAVHAYMDLLFSEGGQQSLVGFRPASSLVKNQVTERYIAPPSGGLEAESALEDPPPYSLA